MRELTPYVVRLPSPPDQDAAAVLIDPLGEAEEGPGLRDYWRLLRKHLWLITLCLLATCLAAALTLFTMTPIYTAATTLLIERDNPQVLDFREVLTASGGQPDFYKTQYEILKSRTLAARVIREQQLETDPAFTGKGQDEGFVAGLWAHAQGWLTAVQRRVKGWVRRFFPLPQQASKPTEEDPLGVRPGLVDAYRGKLNIAPTQGTQLVQIAFNTPDPQLSARLANAHAQAYIHRGVEFRSRANEEAQRFLEENLRELKARVEKSEAALNRYRSTKGIISLDDKENIVVERLADLNRRLTEAEADRIGLESQVRLLRRGYSKSLPAVLNNSLIQNLTEQLARLEGEYTHLAAIFKLGHPRLEQLAAQRDETRRGLYQEIQQVVAGINSAYLAAAAKEKELRAAMEAQKAAALRLKDASVEYAILTREIDTNRQLYDNVLQRMKETGVAAELRSSNVFIIDEANPPRTPSKPKIRTNLLLAAFLGLTGGVGVAFLREHLDNTLKTPQEVERYLRLPNLGVVPDFLHLSWRGNTARRFTSMTPRTRTSLALGVDSGLVLSQHPLYMVTEVYRMLRTAILLSRAEEPPKTILFTSATHGEGKTTTVLNTAIVFAQMGVKVLAIDADLRRSGCHRILGMQNGSGLTEILTGLGEPSELIQPTYTADLFFLGSGSAPPNPAELVGSRKMRETLAAFREQYEYLLIDAPPVLPVSDAVLLSTMVDGVVLVVDGQKTPKPLVREARARLSYARAKVLGAVLNRVDMRNGHYAYGYQPYTADGDHAGAGASRNL